LAVLVETLVGRAAHADGDGRAAIRQSLRERGLLVSAPLEASEGVASDFAWVLASTLRPERVCVLQLARPGGATQTIDLSFTSACRVANRVDADGQHLFAELDSLDEVVDLIATATGLAAAAAPPAKGSVAVDQLLPTADLVAVLLVPSTEATHSLAWVMAGGCAWLVQPSADPASGRAEAIAPEALRALLRASLPG
jgi:hypothetical protein